MTQNKELINLAIEHMKQSPEYTKYAYNANMSDDNLWSNVFWEYSYTSGGYNFEKIYEDGENSDGHDICVVVSVDVPNHGKVLLRMDGVYDSWGGDHFEGSAYIVVPTKVTRTEYLKA